MKYKGFPKNGYIRCIYQSKNDVNTCNTQVWRILQEKYCYFLKTNFFEYQFVVNLRTCTGVASANGDQLK